MRTGGGYEKLDVYLKHYSRSECIELNRLLRDGDGSFKNTVLKILHKNKADKESISRWEKKCSPEMAQHFERIMNEFKILEKKMGTSNLTTPARTTKP